MLGFEKQKTTKISGKYAEDMLKTLERFRSGKFNEVDLKIIKRSKEISDRYNAIWLD